MPFQITERLKWKRLRVTSIFFSLIFQFPPPFATDLVVPRQIVRPQCALIVVDVQNDFISGSLAIDEVRKCNTLSLLRRFVTFHVSLQGEQVVDPINRLVDTVPFVQHWYQPI